MEAIGAVHASCQLSPPSHTHTHTHTHTHHHLLPWRSSREREQSMNNGRDSGCTMRGVGVLRGEEGKRERERERRGGGLVMY